MYENNKTSLKKFIRYAVVKNNLEDPNPIAWEKVLVCPDIETARTCAQILTEKDKSGIQYMYMTYGIEGFAEDSVGPAEMLKSEFPLDCRSVVARIRSRGVSVTSQMEDKICGILSLINAAHNDGIEQGRILGRADALTDLLSTIGDEVSSLHVDLETEKAEKAEIDDDIPY